jgi:hypothetical protein
MTYEHKWHARLGAHAMPLVVGVFVLLGTVIAPIVSVGLISAINRLLVERQHVHDLTRRFVYALVPVGVAMWAAHLLYHFATAWTSAASIVTPVQILLLGAGLLLSLYVILRIAEQSVQGMRRALTVAAPWAALCLTLYVAGIWILFQPMEMRGMIH